MLSRANFGTRALAAKENSSSSAPSSNATSFGVSITSSSYQPLTMFNPFNQLLSSSPELPENSSASPAPSPSPSAVGANGGAAAGGNKLHANAPAPLNVSNGSNAATPCQSPTRHAAPRARIQTPLLPPTPK
jgi:hypothetical protein